MKTYLMVAAIVLAVAVGFCVGSMVHPLSGYAQATKATPKEPKASADEFR